MFNISISDEARMVHPTARYGAMLLRLPEESAFRKDLWERVRDEESAKIAAAYPDYDRRNIKEREPARSYTAYFKRFGKTYPVLMQLESLVLKKRELPRTCPAVEAMFLCEIRSLLLTAGHDRDRTGSILEIGVSKGTESFTGISGKEEKLYTGDLFLSDGGRIRSSILNGPDFESRVVPSTRNVLYFVYGVENVQAEQIAAHLADIERCLGIALPGTAVEETKILS